MFNVESNEGEAQFTCKQCGELINKGLIERKLVDLLGRRVVGYQM